MKFCHKNESGLIKACFKGDTRVLDGCFNDVIRVGIRCIDRVSSVLPSSSRGVVGGNNAVGHLIGLAAH